MSDPRKAQARAWFESLRDRIMAAFEALEDEAPAALYPGPTGRFEKTPWSRGEDEGGGVMGMMRGRLFEKVMRASGYSWRPSSGRAWRS